MATFDPNLGTEHIDEPVDDRKIQTGRTRLIVAGLLSALIPGAGQYLRKRYVSAGGFFTAYFCLWFCFWPVRLPRYPYALIALLWALVTLLVSASLHAAFARDKNGRRLSLVWLLLLGPAAFAMPLVQSNLMDRVAGFGPFDIPSTSMEPTVMKGDHIIVDLRAYAQTSPQKGDVVVFRREGLFVIKRVIAIAGDTIEGKDELIFVNGKEQKENYVLHSRGASAMEQLVNFGPVNVPRGKMFVMGDNRDVSYDSRMPEYGPIEEGSIVGKPLYVIRGPGQRATTRIQ